MNCFLANFFLTDGFFVEGDNTHPQNLIKTISIPGLYFHVTKMFADFIDGNVYFPKVLIFVDSWFMIICIIVESKLEINYLI